MPSDFHYGVRVIEINPGGHPLRSGNRHYHWQCYLLFDALLSTRCR